MVTVIGQDPRFQKTCPECGKELQFKKSDVRAGERAKGYDEDHKSLIVCPCGKVIDVTSTYGTSSSAKYEQQQRDDY